MVLRWFIWKGDPEVDGTCIAGQFDFLYIKEGQFMYNKFAFVEKEY